MDRVQEVHEALLELTNLELNWDGEDGRPPCAKAVATVSYLLHQIQKREGAHPTIPIDVAPMPDGGLLVEWKMLDRRLELFVESNGKMTLVTVLRENGEDIQWAEEAELTFDRLIEAVGGVTPPIPWAVNLGR